jgi:rod shape-determining protein MreC
MAERPQGISRNLDKLVLGLCVVLSIWMSTWSEATKVSRATVWAHVLTSPFEWGVRVIEDAAVLKAQNDELRARLAALALDAAYVENERQRLEELEARAGFYERSRGHLEPAVVFELDRNLIQAKIRIFSDEELRPLLPVVTERGLVGRVARMLGPNEALVRLLPFEDERIAAEVVQSGATGVLGHDGRHFVIDHVPRREDVRVGNDVISSGLGGTVPRGLPLGHVTAVEARTEELFQRITVDSDVDFSALKRVYVVVRDGPWYSRGDDFGSAPFDSTAEERTP